MLLSGISISDALLGGGGVLRQEILNLLGALFTNSSILSLQAWRMITSAFLHSSVLHIGMNMFALWQIGKLVYEYYGGKLLLIIYVLSAIAASIASILLVPSSYAVGASGAIFGILGVIFANTIKRNAYAASFPITQDEILQIFIYSAIITLLPGLQVNIVAHIAGFVAGVGLGYVFDHKLSAYRNEVSQKLENPLYWSIIILLALSFLLLIANFIYGFLLDRPTW